MNRSLEIKKPIKLPKELENFFDDPPLVGLERREDYDKFFFAIAGAIKPTDEIVWVLAREFGDTMWELRRERRIKVQIIISKQQQLLRQALNPVLTRANFERAEILAKKESESTESSLFKKKKLVAEERVKPSEEEAAFLAQVYVEYDRDIDVIDARIASYLSRAYSVLREIQRYSERLARRIEKAATDIIDGEFSDTED